MSARCTVPADKSPYYSQTYYAPFSKVITNMYFSQVIVEIEFLCFVWYLTTFTKSFSFTTEVTAIRIDPYWPCCPKIPLNEHLTK